MQFMGHYFPTYGVTLFEEGWVACVTIKIKNFESLLYIEHEVTAVLENERSTQQIV